MFDFGCRYAKHQLPIAATRNRQTKKNNGKIESKYCRRLFFTVILINKILVHNAVSDSDWIFLSAMAVSYFPRIVWLTNPWDSLPLLPGLTRKSHLSASHLFVGHIRDRSKYIDIHYIYGPG